MEHPVIWCTVSVCVFACVRVCVCVCECYMDCEMVYELVRPQTVALQEHAMWSMCV